jgi:hypothetical protein
MTEIYPASTIKPVTRQRASQRDVEARREGLIAIVAAQRPMIVRQVFYQATVSHVVEKTEAGYAKVQTDLVWLRRNEGGAGTEHPGGAVISSRPLDPGPLLPLKTQYREIPDRVSPHLSASELAHLRAF